MKLIIKIIIVLLFWFFSICINNSGVMAALNSIDVDNNVDQSTVVLKFSSIPVYHSFSLHDPERLVIDIVYYTSMNTDIFPINFSGKNLIKRIRSSMSTNRLNLRLVFDTDNQIFHVQNVLQRKDGDLYYLIFFFTKKVVVSVDKVKKLTYMSDFRKKNLLIDNGKKIFDDGVIIVKKYIMLMLRKWDAKSFEPIVVAIDAGHGGQDPGAVGLNGLCEKNVTIAVAYKLKDKLDANKKFKTVLTRDGDYFLSVMGRSEVARKKGADVLVSIHTDASCNKNVRGASVWILSNRRANSEMGNWLLEEQDKRAELRGGIADLLTTSKYVNPYFDQAILDLQFCHSQRVGYELGMCILHYLRDVVTLHKIQPESSSLGVLRSPDIPSILVEIGFISNLFEEKLLNNKSYQEKIAMAIYKGLYSYFVSHPLYSSRITSNGIFHHCSY